MAVNRSTLCANFAVLLVALQAHGLCQESGEQEKDWRDFFYIEDESALMHTYGGPLVTDFTALKVQQEKFEELSKQTENHDSLLKLLNRLKQSEDAVGVAAFLNQRYPEKSFNPITLPFSVKHPSKIPVDLLVSEKKEIVHVTPECFGKICYAYWSRELEVGEFRHLKVKD